MGAHLLARVTLKTAVSVADRFGSRGVARALRNIREELYIQRLHRASVAAAARLRPAPEIRLNLGSGHHPKPGWINVDLIDGHADLQLDLRQRLPFTSESVTRIYSEHFYEHLAYPNTDESTAWQLETPQSPSDALTLARECFRVLKPGGLLDLVVPDAELILEAYANRHSRPFVKEAWWGPSWCDTPMHLVNFLFRQGTEHQYAYDFETLQGVLERAGFGEISRRDFDPALDHHNATRSLFVRASKPERMTS